jgi:hypothetical protein
MHIDIFSVGLDEIPRKQVTTERILAILHREGRFSCFEASDNPVIARAMTAIMHSNLVQKYVPERYRGKIEPEGTRGPDQDTYPWTYVRLTPEGLKLIGLAA